MTMPQIPDGRAPQNTNARGEVAKLKNSIAETTRRGVISDESSSFSRYVSTPVGMLIASSWNRHGSFFLAEGSGSGITFSGGNLFVLDFGIWEVKASIRCTGGGASFSSGLLFRLADNSNSTVYAETSGTCVGDEIPAQTSYDLSSDGTDNVEVWVDPTKALSVARTEITFRLTR